MARLRHDGSSLQATRTLVWLGVFLLLSVSLIVLDQLKRLSTAEDLAARLILPVQAQVTEKVNPVFELWDTLGQIGRLRQENDLLKRQIRDYREFVKQLVQLGDIMQKRFFIVVPMNPATSQQKTFWQRLSALLTPASLIRVSEERFKKEKFDQGIRVSQIVSGLSAMSLDAVQLDTQGLIELFYMVYNPELYDTQKLTDVSQLQVEGA